MCNPHFIVSKLCCEICQKGLELAHSKIEEIFWNCYNLVSITLNDGTECNSCCLSISHLFQVMKKELNFFLELWTLKLNFLIKNFGKFGSQLHLCGNRPLGPILSTTNFFTWMLTNYKSELVFQNCSGCSQIHISFWLAGWLAG